MKKWRKMLKKSRRKAELGMKIKTGKKYKVKKWMNKKETKKSTILKNPLFFKPIKRFSNGCSFLAELAFEYIWNVR